MTRAARRPARPAARPPVMQDLAIEWVPIDRVIPYADNPRIKHDVDAIASSLRTFGWRQPLVVDKDFALVVGHGRLKGARKNGDTHVPVHVAHGLTPAQIRAYRLADNKAAEGAEWDQPKLLLELQGLRDAGEDGLISLSGFDLNAALEGAAAAAPRGPNVYPQFEGLTYRVVVDCADEQDQAILLERLEGEGRTCRALIS